MNRFYFKMISEALGAKVVVYKIFAHLVDALVIIVVFVHRLFVSLPNYVSGTNVNFFQRNWREKAKVKSTQTCHIRRTFQISHVVGTDAALRNFVRTSASTIIQNITNALELVSENLIIDGKHSGIKTSNEKVADYDHEASCEFTNQFMI